MEPKAKWKVKGKAKAKAKAKGKGKGKAKVMAISRLDRIIDELDVEVTSMQRSRDDAIQKAKKARLTSMLE